MNDLSGQFAVVTGASGAIGAAIATRLAQAGARVCAIGRNSERLQHLAKSRSIPADTIHPLLADLQREAELRSLRARIETLCTEVDILIHCAGRIHTGSLEESRVEQLDEQYLVNVRAPYLLTQVLLPLLRRRAGQVVFINSTVGSAVIRGGISQYAATKHALRAMADSLRYEVNVDGMRVVTVYPGNTASSMYRGLCELEGKPYRPDQLMQPEDIASTVIAALSLPRSAEITDIQMRPLKRS